MCADWGAAQGSGAVSRVRVNFLPYKEGVRGGCPPVCAAWSAEPPPWARADRPGRQSQSRLRRWHLFSWQPGDQASNQLHDLKIGLFAPGAYFLLTEAVRAARDAELLPFLPSSAPDPPARGLRWSFAIPAIHGSLCPLVTGVLGVPRASCLGGSRPRAWGTATCDRRG